MKTRTFILIAVIGGIFSSVNLCAQTERINLSVENVSLKDALKKIESQSKYTFFYNDSKINMNQKVSFNAVNETVSAVLDKVLTNCTYQLQDDRIILIPNKKKESTLSIPIKISGIVIDKDGNPIPGAFVKIVESAKGTICGMDGKYTLDIPSGGARLEVGFIDYETSFVDVKPDKKSVDIVLNKSVN